MLTGRAPFQGTQGEVMHQHQYAPLPLEQLKDVPGPLVVLLETLLQKDPAKRPQSPAELQTLLYALRVDLETKGKAGKRSLSGADAERHRSPGRRGKRRIAVFALLLVVAAAGTLFWFLPKSASPAANSKSVAVLPFENFSDSKENSYFSDGLTSEVIFQLAKVADLRVISRQSVLRYRDTPAEHQKSLSEIGRELGVAAILESSVERIDNRVRIITGLYDVATNKRLWGASYDREIKDIFAIQSDVAEQIAAALKAGLSADERANISQKPTENVAAYDFCLRGWGLYQPYQKDENEKAIDLFKQATDADPKFALAYTGLADAYIERVQRFHGEDFWSDSAIDLCQRAVALDPKEIRSYTELARAFLNKGWHERAHELLAVLKKSGDTQRGRNPATLLMSEGIALHGLGRETEARQAVERCESMASNYLATKKYDEYFNHWLLAFCARFLGRKEEAYKHVQESFTKGDVIFQGFLPDSPSSWIFKPDPEFQAILAEKSKQNAPKRARILAIEKSY
jgi:TolB-like protein